MIERRRKWRSQPIIKQLQSRTKRTVVNYAYQRSPQLFVNEALLLLARGRRISFQVASSTSGCDAAACPPVLNAPPDQAEHHHQQQSFQNVPKDTGFWLIMEPIVREAVIVLGQRRACADWTSAIFVAASEGKAGRRSLERHLCRVRRFQS